MAKRDDLEIARVHAGGLDGGLVRCIQNGRAATATAQRLARQPQGREPLLVRCLEGQLGDLRQIDGAKEQWALENKKTQTDTPVDTDLIGTDKYIKVMPTCPGNGTYAYNNMATKPTCTITDHTLQ